MRLLGAMLALWFVVAGPLPGLAQQPAPQPDEVQTLLKVLEDDAARAKLISKIKETQALPADSPAAPINKLPGLYRRFMSNLSLMSPEEYAQAIGLSLGILLAAWGLARFLTMFLDRGLRLLLRHEETMPGLSERAARYLPFLKWGIRLVLGLGAGGGVLTAFDIDVWGWLAGAQGRWIAARTLMIVLVMAFALGIWELAGAALEGALKRLDGQGRRQGRLKTLIPVLRMVVAVVLIAMSGLIILSELGVNIAPLLAGAGMVGLAVGLGAQKLVQDLLGSVSILLDDTMAVGDIVKIGDHAGVIEKITLMDIRLRDPAGNLHVVPFSKVNGFVNMSVDYAYAVFDIGIAYSANVDEVTKLLTELGGQMAEDEQFGQLIQEPLEVLGLDKFADSAVILKARMRTEPGKQWEVMREFNRRMKAKFDELGIEIPFPQMMVWMGGK